METSALRTAYAEFGAFVRDGSFADPADETWNASLVLAHLVVGDRLIAETAARVAAARSSSASPRR